MSTVVSFFQASYNVIPSTMTRVAFKRGSLSGVGSNLVELSYLINVSEM
jgi:hypothetical protein